MDVNRRDNNKKLISDVKEALIDAPEGIKVNSFWNAFSLKHRYLPDPKEFGVRKRGELLNLCSEVILIKGSGEKERVFYNLNYLETEQDSVKPSQKKSTSQPAQTSEASNILSESDEKLSAVEETMSKSSGNSFYDKFYQRQNNDPYPRGTHPHHVPQPNTGPAAPTQSASATNTTMLHGPPSNRFFAPNMIQPMAVTVKPQVFMNSSAQCLPIPGYQIQPQNWCRPSSGPASNSTVPSSSGSSREESPATSSKKSASATNFVGGGRGDTTSTPVSTKQVQESPKPSGPFRRPTRDQLNSVAEDCIERLAESKDYVSVERITKLLLQHYSVNSISELGLRHIDELKCVYDLIRSECKVNAYIQAFVKVRSICSVYELSECLKEFTQNRQDFETLHHGPLVKLPIVFEYFKMPPESDLCEITTADIIESLRQFLSENNLWMNKQVSLADFLKFITEKRNLTSPYELGVRLVSMPLAIQVLKKAQRDCGQSFRNTTTSLRESLVNDLSTAFRHFTSTILHKETGMCAVRQEYLNLDARIVVTNFFAKLRFLYQIVEEQQMKWEDRNTELTKHARKKREKESQSRALNELTNLLEKDEVLQKLLHIAICVSQEQIHRQITDFFYQSAESNESVISVDSDSDEQLPSIGEVESKILVLLGRCVQHGSLTLELLSKIEEKLLEEFNMKRFEDLKESGFLKFILSNKNIKTFLDDVGGIVLGSSSNAGLIEGRYHVSQDDIREFIRQCKQCGINEQDFKLIEMAICHHYGTKEFKSFGLGSIVNLVKNIEKQNRPNRNSVSIYYESCLIVSKQSSALLSQERTVGFLGHMTKDRALSCLQNCPLLCDMAEWSQWDLVFKPQFKDLKDFIQKHGGIYQTTINVENKQKMLTTDIIAIEVYPGKLLRLTTKTDPEMFAAAAMAKDVSGTCGHLISLIALNGGLENTPLALLGNHFKTALLKMKSQQPVLEDNLKANKEIMNCQIASFVLDCLTTVPLVVGQLIIKQVFLDPLSVVVGQSKSKVCLLSCSKAIEQKTRLQAIGMLLGIQNWSDDFQVRTVPSAHCLESMDFDDVGPIVDITSDSESEESSSDSEFSLSGDDEEKEADASKSKKTKQKESIVRGEEPQKDEIVLDSESASTDSVIDITLDTLKLCEEKITENSTEDSCRQLIDKIRKEEFGLNVELSEDGKKLLLKQQERLGRSLERLSRDLYSKDIHFVLELVQNADDNDYNDNMLQRNAAVVPSLHFLIESDCIAAFNNEVGFMEKNIRAVCDVGRTTKGKHKFGYIGQKGIGFKSVFRVTDKPEIHSNGFHMKFDVKSSPLGYILPHWLEAGESCVPLSDDWKTCIALPLKEEMKVQVETVSLAARFRDIHPSLLLFLHRLRSIYIDNNVEKYTAKMKRTDLDNNVTEISHEISQIVNDQMSHENGLDRWLVIRKTLDASHMSAKAKSGVEVESTEIALAFPILPKKNIINRILPPQQRLFAFLPLRSYGFRFVVHGDFDVPSSREDVDRDSVWNQWLRSEIHQVFVGALEVFKNQADLNPIEAVSYFLQFVPHEDEILDFFRPVGMSILNLLKAQPCLPTQGLQWRIPSQLVNCNDALIRAVVTSSMLRSHLGFDYLHQDVASSVREKMLEDLGVQTITTQHLIEVGKSIIKDLKSAEDFESGISRVSKWLLCVYKSLDEFGKNEDILSSLRSLPMIPLVSGQVVSVESETIFFPLSTLENVNISNRKFLTVLESDMRTVHPKLFSEFEGVAYSQICRLLEQLGVKKLTPYEVISHHILPTLQNEEECMQKPRDLLVTYLIYIKEQMFSHPTLVDFNELKPCAIVLTNKGLKRPSLEPVHFSESYNNPINLVRELPGYEWTLLDNCYLQGNSNKMHVHQWREFFTQLGCLDFLAVRQHKIILKRSDLTSSPWSLYSNTLPVLDEYHINDYQCDEFNSLVQSNTDPKSIFLQMKKLFELIDHRWDTDYTKYHMTQMTNASGMPVKDVETSFSLNIKSLPWIPSSAKPSAFDYQDYRLSVSRDLFIPSQLIVSLLANHVQYITAATNQNSSFTRHLGIQNDLNVELICKHLIQWCARSEDASGTPTSFKTSLNHMSFIYRYLFDNLPRNKLHDLARDHPIIFHTRYMHENPSILGDGQFLRNVEARWSDPSGLFNKYSESLSAMSGFSGLSTSSYRLTIIQLYPNLQEFFVQICCVQRKPDVGDYIKLLVHVTSTSSFQTALADVLLIFSIIGEEITKSGFEVEKFKSDLKEMDVIPSKANKWINLECNPLIADDKQLEKMFPSDSGVHFVDCGEKLGIGDKRKINKELDMIKIDYIHAFLTAIGIQRLTECVKCESMTESYRPCPSLQSYVRSLLSYIQKLICSEFPKIHEYLVTNMGIKQKLAAMQFAQVAKLEMVHTLTNAPSVHPVVFNEKCRLVDDNVMYVHMDNVASYSDINKELARYFSRYGLPCPPEMKEESERCFKELKLTLGEILPLIQTKSPELARFLDDHNLTDLPETEEIWEIPEPKVIIERASRMLSSENMPTAGGRDEMDEEMPEESDGLRSWPPKSHSGSVVGGSKHTAGQVPQIWPPPAQPYHRDYSQLPDNLRPSRLVRSDENYRDDNRTHEENGEKEGDLRSPPIKRENTSDETGEGEKRFENRLQRRVETHDNAVQGGESVKDSSKCETDNVKELAECGTEMQEVVETPANVETPTKEIENIHDAETAEKTETLEKDDHSEPGDAVVESAINVEQAGRSSFNSSTYNPLVIEFTLNKTEMTVARAGHKRARINSGTMENDLIKPREKQHITSHFYGPPVWLAETDENVFQHLGTADNLSLPSELMINDSSDPTTIGEWGEQLVKNYLEKHRHQVDANIAAIEHSNSTYESGLPYDFIIHKNDGEKIYLEVKTTISDSKACFGISINQLVFAQEKGAAYHLYRVFCAGDTQNVRLSKIENLAEKLEKKHVRLMMIV